MTSYGAWRAGRWVRYDGAALLHTYHHRQREGPVTDQRTGPANRRVRPWSHGDGGYTKRASFTSGQDLVATRCPIAGRRSTDQPPPRAQVQRAKVDRRVAVCYGVPDDDGRRRRNKSGVLGRRFNEHDMPDRPPTSADRFDVRFAAELIALRDAICKDCARGIETITEKHHGETVLCHWHQASQEGYGRLSLRCRCPDALHDRLSALLREPERETLKANCGGRIVAGDTEGET